MIDIVKGFPARVITDERGQALPWMVFLIVLFLGITGLSVDLGHAYVCYRELQYSTDAAALAGGYALGVSTATTASVKSAATAYSSVSPGVNVNTALPSPTISTTMTCVKALDNSTGVPCSASPTDDNAIQVTQTATIPTYFIRALSFFGVKSATSMTLSATATATTRGAANEPYNVAIVIDTTASMGDTDSDASCDNKRITCALSGVQTLLEALTPCSAGSTSTTCKAGFDNVSLFTFPNVEASTTTDDTTCPSSDPKVVTYTTPVPGATYTAPSGTTGSYQITSYLDNYSATNAAGGALNSSSALAIATGGGVATKGKTCSGLQTPGGESTYLPGAIYAAQASLAAEQAANPGSQNALIILSDGDQEAASSNISATKPYTSLTTTGTYPSAVDECQQGVTAAQYATAAGTTVYSIAYGASSTGGKGGCTTDTSGALKGISPCTEMEDMASAPGDFYSDATASENSGQCTSSSNPNLTLSGIFTQLKTQFTRSALIPNSVF